MNVYHYRAQNKMGRVVQGKIRAADVKGAHQQLKGNDLVPIAIRSAEEALRHDAAAFARRRVNARELIVFSRQFAALLNAGVPMIQALQALRKQATCRALQAVTARIEETVTGGARLSETLAEFPRAFSREYVHMVASGETGGNLVETLGRIADWMERELEIRSEIVAAVRYPVTVLIALVLAAILMVVKVIPIFAKFFARARVPLPWPTRALVAGNAFIQEHWLAIAAGVAAVVAAVFVLLRLPAVRLAWDRLKFRLPVLGTLYGKIVISRFARIFSALVRGGVPVMKALEVAPGVVANAHLRAAVREVLRAIQGGASVVVGFERGRLFPPIMISLVGIGEKTGTLDDMLEHVVAQFETDVRYALRNLTHSIEPIITVVVGIAVLFLALAVYLPIWSLSGVIR
ncbi:MAG: type II secretion system F family protein [Verrucomicrobiota bacterium]|nr:type II secretion system F family protein [Verrucomicrobiota bacterium]